MFPARSLLSLLLVAVSCSAAAVPVARDLKTLAFARLLNVTGGSLNIAEADRARFRVLKEQALGQAGTADKRAASVLVTNTAVTYTANVGVGTPPTEYTLLIDTGSSNTWVGANKTYVVTSSSVSTGKTVKVSYGSGSFSGTEYTDTVTLGTGLTVTKASIGVATAATGFDGVDGILGLGPNFLTLGTVSGTLIVDTIADDLKSQGVISTESIGIYYAPTTSESVGNGELTFGGVDTSKYTGTITYTPISAVNPAGLYWGIDQKVTYGLTTTLLSAGSGIVDTGTTLILIASDAYATYVSQTGGVLDSATGLLEITAAQYASLKSLYFTIAGTTFNLVPNAQIWPRALNSYIGGNDSSIYLVVGNSGLPSGDGLDFINGYAFLERFYSVFDTTNKRVGFATTAYTSATTN
ncbi:family A1 protease [Athelia psychrophila]|uniref:Family A1 protease n=1 Tax=Athelia psychrophila TaxID=1759441 RepID=A0A165YT34_9AGAM|nr:family A1 protease [Fibularhizoctonia sp. CBS 109695]